MSCPPPPALQAMEEGGSSFMPMGALKTCGANDLNLTRVKRPQLAAFGRLPVARHF